MSPGSIPGPGVICGLSLLLVLYFAPRGFSPGTTVLPCPQKPTFPNSNSTLECTGFSERVPASSLVFRGYKITYLYILCIFRLFAISELFPIKTQLHTSQATDLTHSFTWRNTAVTKGFTRNEQQLN